MTGADVAAVAATSMREGMVLYDAGGREIFACPNVDSRASAEAEDLIREGAAEKIYAEAGDWVSITPRPGCAGWAGTGPRSCATPPAWACSATGSCTGSPAST